MKARFKKLILSLFFLHATDIAFCAQSEAYSKEKESVAEEPFSAKIVSKIPSDDARSKISKSQGGLRDGDKVSGKVRELGEASLVSAVNRSSDGAPR